MHGVVLANGAAALGIFAGAGTWRRNNPVPQHQLGVGRWGKEVTTVKDFTAASEGEPTDNENLDADTSVDAE